MANPANTMLNYFKKLPSKTNLDTSTSVLGPHRQHVTNFKVEQFDELLRNPCLKDTSYIFDLKSGQHKPIGVKKHRRPMRAKLLQFSEDVRPPYYGTWRKKSRRITGRRPYECDNDIFDYDVDSEAEWDIGGPGESLKDSDEEVEILDDYEIDMKTFVPHGYVSDDEVDEAPNTNNETEPILLLQHKNNVTPITLGISFDIPSEILREFEGFAC